MTAGNAVERIKELYYLQKPAVNGKRVIEDSFPLEISYKNYIERIRSLVYEKNEGIDII